jgi:hypothetical protein
MKRHIGLLSTLGGFADLTPGSGHGTGGYSDMGWIEVYGKAVKRDAAK